MADYCPFYPRMGIMWKDPYATRTSEEMGLRRRMSGVGFIKIEVSKTRATNEILGNSLNKVPEAEEFAAQREQDNTDNAVNADDDGHSDDDDSTQIFVIPEKKREVEERVWIIRMMKTLTFGNYHKVAEVSPTPAGLIIYYVIEKGRLIKQYMVDIHRLPRFLQRVIDSMLPAKKRMMVVNVDDCDNALMSSERQVLPLVVLTSWLRMSETADSIYFLDASRVVHEQVDEAEVDLEGHKKAESANHEQEDLYVQRFADISSPNVMIPKPRSIVRSPPVLGRSSRTPSAAFCGLGALAWYLFKK